MSSQCMIIASNDHVHQNIYSEFLIKEKQYQLCMLDVYIVISTVINICDVSFSIYFSKKIYILGSIIRQ